MAAIELDVPDIIGKREPVYHVPTNQRSTDMFSMSYRRQTRPASANANIGLQVRGTTAPTKVPLPVPFCFVKNATMPTRESGVQFLFIPNASALPSETDEKVCLGPKSMWLDRSQIAYQNWALLYGFHVAEQKESTNVPLLEYLGDASSSVQGTFYVTPSGNLVRLLSDLQKMNDNRDEMVGNVLFRGAVCLPVWTSFQRDAAVCETCVLAIVLLFDQQRRQRHTSDS